jgi:cell division protein FtsB
MSNKNKLSPTNKVSYVQKASSKGSGFRVLKQIIISVFILGVFVLIIIPYLENRQKRLELERQIMETKDQIIKYEDSNVNLKELLTYLESDQAIEERARLNLGLQKEGEQVVIIKRSEFEEVLDSEEEDVDLSNFQKWIRYFFYN